VVCQLIALHTVIRVATQGEMMFTVELTESQIRKLIEYANKNMRSLSQWKVTPDTRDLKEFELKSAGELCAKLVRALTAKITPSGENLTESSLKKSSKMTTEERIARWTKNMEDRERREAQRNKTKKRK
jgi:hypothetical protein